MQGEPQSWRDVIHNVIQDGQEKRRLAALLGVDPRTISRWIEHSSIPRVSNFLQLLDALPQYSSLLRELIIHEFPEMQEVLGTESREGTESDIPSALYDVVLQDRKHPYTPLIHWSICTRVLESLVNQIDTDQQGVAVVLVECVPPHNTAQTKVQSLRETQIIFSRFWGPEQAYNLFFRGIESLARTVVTTYQPIIHQDTKSLALVQLPEYIQSVVGFPLLWEGRIAGCLLVLGTQTNYFTRLRTALIHKYSTLLALAFPAQEFYEPQHIDLQTTTVSQGELLSRFHQRVQIAMVTSNLSQTEAEQQVLQHIFPDYQ